MNEVLLCQRFTYANINIEANYSRLADKDKYFKNNYDILSDIDNTISLDSYVKNAVNPQRFFFPVPHEVLRYNKLASHRKNNFYPFVDKDDFHTIKDQQIKRNYNICLDSKRHKNKNSYRQKFPKNQLMIKNWSPMI